MQALTQFVEDNNRWTSIFGDAPITFPLSQQDVDQLTRTIDAKLSPENLHCDGEIPASEANRRYRVLTKVAGELSKYCEQNSLTQPTMYEL